MEKKSQWKKKKAEPYKPVDPDEPNDNVVVYKNTGVKKRQSENVAEHKQPTVNKFNSRDWEQKKKVADRLAKIKQKRKTTKEDKRGVLIIRDYMSYLHMKYGGGTGTQMEVHHWMPKSRIKHNDFFVCCIPPDEHYEIHHGGGSVNAFIEKKGIGTLLVDSAIMFAEWLATEDGHRHRHSDVFTAMIQDIGLDPENYDHVLETTRRYAEEIRLQRRK